MSLESNRPAGPPSLAHLKSLPLGCPSRLWAELLMKLSYFGLTRPCLSGRQVTLSGAVAAVTAIPGTVEPAPDLGLGLCFYCFASEHLTLRGCCWHGHFHCCSESAAAESHRLRPEPAPSPRSGAFAVHHRPVDCCWPCSGYCLRFGRKSKWKRARRRASSRGSYSWPPTYHLAFSDLYFVYAFACAKRLERFGPRDQDWMCCRDLV